MRASCIVTVAGLVAVTLSGCGGGSPDPVPDPVPAPPPFTTVLETGDTLAGFGELDGFTFPRVGGDKADQTVFGGYGDGTSALLIYNSMTAARLDGINSTTKNAAGEAFNGFGDFGVSSGSHRSGQPVITFISNVGAVDGVFLQLPSGVIIQVVSTAQMWGPTNDTFYSLSEPSTAVSEDKTQIYVAFAARAGSTWRGILRAAIPEDATSDAQVELTTVADTSTAIPTKGNVSVNFRCLSVPQSTPQGDVVFFGSNCGSNTSPLIQAQFSKQAFWKGKPRDHSSLTKNNGPFVGASHVNPGIWRWGPSGGLVEVVNFETTIPHGEEGESFVAFSDPGVGLDGTAAFVGLGNAGTYGLFKGNRNKALTLVAGKQTPVPGYPSYNFSNIPNVPSIGPKGEVVFFGAATSSVAGIFAEDPNTGALSTVIDYDTLVEGKELLYIGYGAQAYSNNLASTYMVLNDTTCGVFNLAVTHTIQMVL